MNTWTRFGVHGYWEFYGILVYLVNWEYNFEDWAKELGVLRELGVLCELGALRVLESYVPGALRELGVLVTFWGTCFWSTSRLGSSC